MILTNGSIANIKVTVDIIFHNQVGHFRKQVVRKWVQNFEQAFLNL